MPRTQALSEREIRSLFRTAKRIIRDPGFDILIAPSTQAEGRLLVVTSRRTGNAPQRNKVRRRIKAIFYEQALSKRGYDCAIIVKKPGISVEFAQIQELMLKAFEMADAQTK